MLIQCTKKLLDELGIKAPPLQKGEGLFSWHANLFYYNRRKTMVMVNDSNRYVIVLHGLKKRDFEHLDELIPAAIKSVFQDECIDEAIIDEYLRRAGEVVFTRTTDKSSISRVVKAGENVSFYSRGLAGGDIIQGELSRRISRLLIGTGQGGTDYTFPHLDLMEDLEELRGGPVVKCRAAVMKVRLDLDNFDVWRQLVIPLNFTFGRLHDVLQIAFGWRDYHLHEFFIYGEKGPVDWYYINHPAFHKEGYKPVLNLVCAEEDLKTSSATEQRLDRVVRLAEVPFKIAKYNYDFGDDWQHYIVVEKVIDDHVVNHPVCLDGSGDAPPEDVGGEMGYALFVKAMADKNHPEHENCREWIGGLNLDKFDLAEVNRRFLFV